MEFLVRDNILHIIYNKKENISKEIIEIANAYEGEMKQRIGFNFPISFIKKHFPKSTLLSYKADYIIVYQKKDIQTKKHELQHALYALNESFRSQVQSIWNSFPESYKQQIISLLLKMNYPNNNEILLDEFQAYYFTEKPNFFGKSY
jgi:hypothetical protein